MELDENTKNQIENMIGENEVFLFMKGNPDFPMCGFSSVASAILKKCGVDFGHCNVLDDENIREGIKSFSDGDIHGSTSEKYTVEIRHD